MATEGPNGAVLRYPNGVVLRDPDDVILCEVAGSRVPTGMGAAAIGHSVASDAPEPARASLGLVGTSRGGMTGGGDGPAG